MAVCSGGAPWPGSLPGRAFELSRIEPLLERVENGLPQYLAIEGPPGIGKTTLINHLLERVPLWHPVVVELDPSDQDVPGSVVHRMLMSLTGSRSHQAEARVQDLVQLVMDVVSRIDGQTCLVLEDVQWIDQLSAEVLWHCARDLRAGRSLVVVSYRPNNSVFSSRITRFLASGRNGEHLILSPLTVDGVRAVLEERLSVPVSSRIARIVFEATSGVPLLLNTIATWLATAPANQRDLPSALAALDTMHDGHQRIFTEALLASLARLSAPDRAAVYLLAIAETPMRLPQLKKLVSGQSDQAVSIRSLVESGLVIRRPETDEVAVAHPQLSILIAQQLAPQDQAELHSELADSTSAEISLRHRVRAQILVPDDEHVGDLLSTLEGEADSALADGRFEAAFWRLRWATYFSDDPQLLHRAIRAAILSEPRKLLPTIRVNLSKVAVSRAGYAAGAYLELAEGDLAAALHEIRRGLQLADVPDDYAGTILLGHALKDVGRVADAQGLLDLAASEFEIARTQLRQARMALSWSEIPKDQAQKQVAEIKSLEAQLALWSGLRQGNPRQLDRFTTRMGAILDDLRTLPDTEAVVDAISGVLGAVLRRTGNSADAYPLLQGAYERQHLYGASLVRLASQLALIAFESGYWDDAQQLFSRALEDCLLLPEDAVVLQTHAWAALVPLARGELREGEALLRLVTTRNQLPGDSVNIAVLFSRAMGALMANDHTSAAALFGAIDNVQTGWAQVGAVYTTLYARSLAYTGKVELIPHVRRRIEFEASVLPAELRKAVDEGIGAASSWAEGDPVAAFHKLRNCISLLDELPPVRPGAVASPGGGYAVIRAFATFDLALVTMSTPELTSHRFDVVGIVQEGAAAFLRCGATVMHQRATELAEFLVRGNEPVDADGEEWEEAGSSEIEARERAYQRLSDLSSRERQIALEVAQGKTNRAIATSLFLSVRTVEFHVANCLSKLGLSSRVELRATIRPALKVRLVPAARSA